MISKNIFLALALCAFSEGSSGSSKEDAKPGNKEVTPATPATDPAKPATDPAKPIQRSQPPIQSSDANPATPATDPAKPATDPAKAATKIQKVLRGNRVRKDLDILYEKRNAAKKTKEYVIEAEKKANDKEHDKDLAESFASQSDADQENFVQAVHDAAEAQKVYKKAQEDAPLATERLERFEKLIFELELKAAKKTKKDFDAHVITAEKEANDKEHAKDVAESFASLSDTYDTDHENFVQAVHDAADAKKAYEKAQEDARIATEKVELLENQSIPLELKLNLTEAENAEKNAVKEKKAADDADSVANARLKDTKGKHKRQVEYQRAKKAAKAAKDANEKAKIASQNLEKAKEEIEAAKAPITLRK